MKKWLFCLASLFLMFLLIPSKAYASISYVNPKNGTIDDLPNAIGESDKVQVIWTVEDGEKVTIDGKKVYGKAFKVNLKKGYYALYIDGLSHGATDGDYWDLCGALFTDKKLQNPADSYGEKASYSYDFEEGYYGSGASTFYISKAGTYYIGIYNKYKTNLVGVECTFSLNMVNTAGSTIKTGRYGFTNKGKGATNTFTFVPTKTGQLKVRPSRSAKVSLKNKSGKVISKITNNTEWVVFFGVKKGVTYQIVIEPNSSSKGRYNILVSNVRKSVSGGTSRKKAQTIKKGSKKTGVLVAGKSTTRWYKITLTKKKKLKLELHVYGCQKTIFTLYKGKSTKALQTIDAVNYYDDMVYDYESELYGVTSGAAYYGLTTKTLAAGTYYLRVSRGNATSSGTYQFSWDYN